MHEDIFAGKQAGRQAGRLTDRQAGGSVEELIIWAVG